MHESKGLYVNAQPRWKAFRDHQAPKRRRFIADRAQNDPTQTQDIREEFARDLTARWLLLRRLVQEAAPIISGTKSDAGVAGWLGIDRAGPFRQWLDTAMEHTVLENNGSWMDTYIQRAVDIAERRAVALGGAVLGSQFAGAATTLEGVAVSELRGICAAVLQQATREAAVMALSSASAENITQMIFSRIDALGRTRSKQMAEYMVVKTHALATLASFGAAGIQQVGMVPEGSEEPPQEQKKPDHEAVAAGLAALAGVAGGLLGKPLPRWQAAAMRRAAGEQEPEDVPEAPHIAELKRMAEEEAIPASGMRVRTPPAELPELPWAQPVEPVEPVEPVGRVDVQTAGDDRVCPICIAIAKRGPYTLEEASGLIPAHPNCRCAFVPAKDEE